MGGQGERISSAAEWDIRDLSTEKSYLHIMYIMHIMHIAFIKDFTL